MYENDIKKRRPYYNFLELKAASQFLEEQVKRTGYLCPIDAYVEQIAFWFPKIIRKRPRAEYGVQLMIEFPDLSISYNYPVDKGHINFWKKYKETLLVSDNPNG